MGLTQVPLAQSPCAGNGAAGPVIFNHAAEAIGLIFRWLESQDVFGNGKVELRQRVFRTPSDEVAMMAANPTVRNRATALNPIVDNDAMKRLA
jgi:hypothetical protein